MARFKERNLLKEIDWTIVICMVALIIYGLICIAIATANPVTGEETTLAEKLATLDLTLVTRQMIWFIVGSAAFVFILAIDFKFFKELTKIFYISNIALLLLLFFLATVVKSTVSWYKFGSIGFQPSEICKITLILMLARIFGDRHPESKLESFRDVFWPLLVVGIAFILVALQPDVGTAMVYVAIAAGMFFAARISWKPVAVLTGGALVSLPLIWMMLGDYQKNRILVFFNSNYDTSGAGYNVRFSKIAIGSGKLTGRGMFSEGGLSQLNWVPEKETDFIFSVTAETFGFIGGMILIGLYILLIVKIMLTALKCRDRFGSFICIGVASMLMFHIFENIGMSMGVMPVTGIPLPFMSYGGSNLLTNMMAVALVVNIGARNKRRAV